jgi:hypothetical protein
MQIVSRKSKMNFLYRSQISRKERKKDDDCFGFFSTSLAVAACIIKTKMPREVFK